MTTIAESERYDWFRKLRAEWFRVMRPFGAWVPWELRELVELPEQVEEPSFWGRGLLTEAPQLEEAHLRHCAVVPTRTHLLRRLPRGGVVAELGVLHGAFSTEIFEITQPSTLHLIDHEIRPEARAVAARAPGRIHVHEGDSAGMLAAFPDGYFDWIYIDAQHAYDGVKRDIEVGRRKVKADGWLVFNDYIPWSYVEMEPYGVVTAVNELCLQDGWEMVCLALPSHLYCDVAIRRAR